MAPMNANDGLLRLVAYVGFGFLILGVCAGALLARWLTVAL